jgi:amidase
MNRRHFLQVSAMTGAYVALRSPARAADAAPPDARWEHAGIPELQSAMQSGAATAAALVEHFVRRINEIDRAGPSVNSVIETNPEASDIAGALDGERKSKAPRGPLHGVPVLVKDNLDTHDRMMTTAGSLALLGSVAPRDSTVVKKLRDAGAVLLGKTTSASGPTSARTTPPAAGAPAAG